MFGYIMPKICDLRVWENDLFKAYYCGLCKTLKKEYNKSAILNYDCTFIYILADSLNEENTQLLPCKCALHPIEKRRKVISKQGEFAASLNVILMYAKILDDEKDKGKKFLKPFFNKAFKKACRNLPSISKKMLIMNEENAKCEEKKTKSTDEAAQPFAHFMGEVLSDIDVLQSHILYDLGYNLGRWVYFIDAIDDFKKDMEKNDYNVYTLNYKENEIRGNTLIYNSLCYTLAQAANAFEKLELKKNKEMLKNIMYLGLNEKTKSVLGLNNESI